MSSNWYNQSQLLIFIETSRIRLARANGMRTLFQLLQNPNLNDLNSSAYDIVYLLTQSEVATQIVFTSGALSSIMYLLQENILIFKILECFTKYSIFILYIYYCK